MGRSYAGVLGYLAAAIVLTRGILMGSGVVGTLQLAIAAMALFATIGFVVGTIAQSTIDQSVRQQMELQLAGVATEKEI